MGKAKPSGEDVRRGVIEKIPLFVTATNLKPYLQGKILEASAPMKVSQDNEVVALRPKVCRTCKEKKLALDFTIGYLDCRDCVNTKRRAKRCKDIAPAGWDRDPHIQGLRNVDFM